MPAGIEPAGLFQKTCHEQMYAIKKTRAMSRFTSVHGQFQYGYMLTHEMHQPAGQIPAGPIRLS